MFAYGQIPLDGPDRTGPDPTRQVFASRVSDKVSDIACFLLNSTTRARPDFVVDFPGKNPPRKFRPFLKMAEDRNCCRFLNYNSMQLSGCEFVTEKETKTLRVGEKVHPRKRTVRRMQHSTAGPCCYGSGEMRSVYANGHRGI